MVLFSLIPVNQLATVLQWGLVTLHSWLETPSHEVSITVFMYLLGLFNYGLNLYYFLWYFEPVESVLLVN